MKEGKKEMYKKDKNEIYFPHVIPGNVLGGIEHSWKKSVNGGAKPIADLCIEPNSFFGGNVVVLGMIKEYGFYACQHRFLQEIVGFYVHDPDMVTDYGKKLLKQRFPGTTIKYEIYTDKPLTEKQMKSIKEAKQYGLDHGLAPILVDTSTASQIPNLLAAIGSGKAEKPLIVAGESVPVSPMQEEPVIFEHTGEELAARVLGGRVQPRSKR